MIATGSKTGGPQASGPLTGLWPRQEPGCTAGGEQQASEQSFIRIYSRSPSLTSLLQSCLTHCDPMACSPPATGDPMAPLSMGFSRQEYWSGLPCPPPGDLPLDFSKGHNKYNTLEIIPPTPGPWKTVFHKTGPWCQKGLGPLL